MDAFSIRTKPTSSSVKPKPRSGNAEASTSSSKPKPVAPIHGGVKRANASLLKTLGEDGNAITNSDAYSHTMHVQSCATGHQRSDGKGPSWRLHRNAKLKAQAAEQTAKVLQGVVAYINGYTGPNVTNLGLIQHIQQNGGEIRYVYSATCTHIFTTQGLSAKKTQALIEATKCNKTKVVTPDWALASIEAGRRLPEAPFSVIEFETQKSVRAVLKGEEKQAKRHVSAYESSLDVPSASTSASPPRLVRPTKHQRQPSSPRVVPTRKKISTRDGDEGPKKPTAIEMARQQSAGYATPPPPPEPEANEWEDIDEWDMPISGQR